MTITALINIVLKSPKEKRVEAQVDESHTITEQVVSDPPCKEFAYSTILNAEDPVYSLPQPGYTN